jgi:hypothetical protein
MLVAVLLVCARSFFFFFYTCDRAGSLIVVQSTTPALLFFSFFVSVVLLFTIGMAWRLLLYHPLSFRELFCGIAVLVVATCVFADLFLFLSMFIVLFFSFCLLHVSVMLFNMLPRVTFSLTFPLQEFSYR